MHILIKALITYMHNACLTWWQHAVNLACLAKCLCYVILHRCALVKVNCDWELTSLYLHVYTYTHKFGLKSSDLLNHKKNQLKVHIQCFFQILFRSCSFRTREEAK